MTAQYPASIRELTARRERGKAYPLDDLASLTYREIRALVAWRDRHGTLVLTREDPGRARLRLFPVVVPLCETFSRADCGRLVFLRRLREEGRLT